MAPFGFIMKLELPFFMYLNLLKFVCWVKGLETRSLIGDCRTLVLFGFLRRVRFGRMAIRRGLLFEVGIFENMAVFLLDFALDLSSLWSNVGAHVLLDVSDVNTVVEGDDVSVLFLFWV